MALRSDVPDMFCIQPGCCEYQARAWPRTRLPLLVAQFRTRSPLVKVNWFWFGSVASAFISFSGVTIENSRLAIVVYVESLSRLAAMAVPKYRPLPAAADCRVLPAAAAGTASATVRPAAAMPPIAAAKRPRRCREVVIDPPGW